MSELRYPNETRAYRDAREALLKDEQELIDKVKWRREGKIFHFWGTELSANHVDTVWPYWNLMDFTPEGRPNRDTPPQDFRSEFLEKHYLEKK